MESRFSADVTASTVAVIVHMNKENYGYRRSRMRKEMIVEKLRERGCRITKQRLMLIDIILEQECSSCKEIYYKAVKKDGRIGTATVYRMVNILEEIGAISRKSLYQVACTKECEMGDACTVELDDDTVCHLSAKNWNRVVKEGLKACGYMQDQNLRAIIVRECDCMEEST